MKVLLDQNLPPRACELLRAEGLDAVHCQEAGLATASDEEILRWCGSESRVLFTRDADFHALLAASGAAAPSVVRIRIDGLDEQAVAKLVSNTVRDLAVELEQGVAGSLNPDSVRIHRLPLASKEPE